MGRTKQFSKRCQKVQAEMKTWTNPKEIEMRVPLVQN